MRGKSEELDRIDMTTLECTEEEMEEDERQWDASFVKNRDVLVRMANKALANFNTGQTEPLDPDNL